MKVETQKKKKAALKAKFAKNWTFISITKVRWASSIHIKACSSEALHLDCDKNLVNDIAICLKIFL